MKLRKIIVPTLFLLTLSTLTGCNPSQEEDEDPIIEVNSLKSAVKYLCAEKNYTLSFVTDKVSQIHDVVYTKDSIGTISSNSIEVTDVYVQHHSGVYRLRNDGVNYLAGEIIDKSESLWGNTDYVYTLFGLDSSFVDLLEDSSTSLTVKNKDFKIRYAYSVGYTQSDIPNINSLNLSYREDNNDKYLRFDLDILGNHVIYDAHKFNSSNNIRVDDFLSQGGSPLFVQPSLDLARSLVKGNNFKQLIYYFNGEDSGFVGTYYFHEHYFASYYTSASTTLTGAIELKKKTDEYDLNGCYYFQIVDGKPSLSPNPVYSKPDIVECYHYPTYLSLWDNFEYVKPFEEDSISSYAIQGEAYYFDNLALMNDFAANFSIDQSFTGQVPNKVVMDVVVDNEGTQVIFLYEFKLDGYRYLMPIPLFDFGNVSISTLDQIYDLYNE